jgi:hypothetical protein
VADTSLWVISPETYRGWFRGNALVRSRGYEARSLYGMSTRERGLLGPGTRKRSGFARRCRWSRGTKGNPLPWMSPGKGVQGLDDGTVRGDGQRAGWPAGGDLPG